MGRPEEVARSLKEGKSPGMIAEILGVSHTSVMGYLYRALGQGLILKSHILFVIERLKAAGETLGYDDLQVHAQLTKSGVASDDMRTLVSGLEVALHRKIREVLVQAYGPEDWWRKGVPESVRVDCVTLRERDPEPAPEPYSYTTLIDLKRILERQWNTFAKALPKTVSSHKNQVLSSITKVNQLRNRVMHPVSDYEPNEDEFRFLSELPDHLQLQRWGTPD
jgi:hypothetical protein